MPRIAARPAVPVRFLFALLAAHGASANASPAAPGGAETAEAKTVPFREGRHRMDIRMAIGSTTLTATLDDNPTARDFAALLPLTVTLQDFHSTEKISGELPGRLSQEGAPASAAGAAGDIAFYAPWGNLALFHRPGPDARGLIKMGRIVSGIEALERPGPLRVTISRADQR